MRSPVFLLMLSFVQTIDLMIYGTLLITDFNKLLGRLITMMLLRVA